ncbi:MAG: nuclear transport factor 2 family protein [Alphaproteobacteria bacterium]|nr:nuclear transport factor 2 family protein [Alphaproteobacteria bacterium]
MNEQHMLDRVHRYFERMNAADIDGIIDLFGSGAHVNSPFLGRVDAPSFFRKLGKASNASRLTVFDVLVGVNGNSAAAHFEYDWTLANGDQVTFQGIDYFTFDQAGDFKSMSIFYDTHPLREEVGDKYANA